MPLIGKNELWERLNWLILLRWFAVTGVFIVITGTKYVFGFDIPLFQLVSGIVILVIFNIFFRVHNSYLKSQKNTPAWFGKAAGFANVQIFVDLSMLTYFIHFSGGMENIFIFYFIFHIVIASVLLSKKAAFLQATLAVALLGTLVLAEQLKLVPHYHLAGFIPSDMCLLDSRYVYGMLFVFATTLYITAYMTTSIAAKLKSEEEKLADANEQLALQDRLKSQYVLTVAHDIGGALSAVQSCLKVVLCDYTGAISDKSREMVARAENRITYLLKFVKDLLDLSKMRAGLKMKKEKIFPAAVARKIIEQLSGNINEKKLKIDILSGNENIFIYADPGAWEQLMSNLLANAVKYTPPEGRVSLKIGEKQNNIEMEIRDTGIGIPENDLENIFKDFFRSKNAEDSSVSGTGLGLSIAKHIVDRHEGKIWCESKAGEGSSFFVTVPKGEKNER